MTPPLPPRPIVPGNGEIQLRESVGSATTAVARRPPDRPAPRRTVRAPTADKLIRDCLRTFEAVLGGRKRLIETMSLASAAPAAKSLNAEYLLTVLTDPDNAHRSITAIAKDAGVTLEQFLAVYREAKVTKAHLAAMEHVFNQLAEVTADVMMRAVPYAAPCPTCSGTTKITPEPTRVLPNPQPMTCPTCRGRGELQYTPDLKTQELALKLGGLLKGEGTTLIQSQVVQQSSQTTVVTPHTSTLLKLQQLTDAALYGSPDVIDADPITDPDPTPDPEGDPCVPDASPPS